MSVNTGLLETPPRNESVLDGARFPHAATLGSTASLRTDVADEPKHGASPTEKESSMSSAAFEGSFGNR